MEFSVEAKRRSVGSEIVGRARAIAVSVPGSIALGTIGLAVLSQVVIPLPFTPVPVSLGTLGALLLGVFLGPRRGMAAAALYAVAGAAGLPVLAGFQSGVMITSFGYAIGYIAAAGLVGWWVRRRPQAGFGEGLLVAVSGSLILYPTGIAWLMAISGMPFLSALSLGFVPFMIGDALKSLVVAGAIRAVKS